MTPKNKKQSDLQENRFLKRIILVLIALCFVLAFGVWRLPNNILVHTAPDVTKPFVQKMGEVPLSSVHGFARILWESLNYCQEDCGDEYLEQINKYTNYLTKSCKRKLVNHFNDQRTLYQHRSRQLLPTDNTLFSNDKIKRVSDGMWYVKLEYNVRDDVSGIETRNNIIIYPLVVVQSTKPISVNPIGLEVDCYFGKGPALLDKREVNSNYED